MPDDPFAQIPLDLIREAHGPNVGAVRTYGMLAAYVDWRNRRGSCSWPDLAADLGVSRTTVWRHISWLVERGYVVRLSGWTGWHARQIYELPLKRPR